MNFESHFQKERAVKCSAYVKRWAVLALLGTVLSQQYSLFPFVTRNPRHHMQLVTQEDFTGHRGKQPRGRALTQREQGLRECAFMGEGR